MVDDKDKCGDISDAKNGLSEYLVECFKNEAEPANKTGVFTSGSTLLLNAKVNEKVGVMLKELIETINLGNHYKASIIAKNLANELSDVWQLKPRKWFIPFWRQG